MIAWISFALAVVSFVAAVVLFWHNRSLKKSRDDRWFESMRGPGPVYLRSDDYVSCEGCGCLLHKESQFEQPPTIAQRVYADTPRGPLRWMNAIVEHYLCLRCQVDGVPPAKMAEAIDEAQKAAGGKPC